MPKLLLLLLLTTCLTTSDRVVHQSLFETAAFERACSELAARPKTPGALVNVAEYVVDGTYIALPDNDPTCNTIGQNVTNRDICRLALYVTTSTASGIDLELWLPNNWSGRFLSLGNSGLTGCIQYSGLSADAALGFATVSTIGGHNGTGGTPFLNNPDVVEDFSWRSVHTAAATGWREGLKSAQDWPRDYDGIVVGAPAINWNALLGWAGWLSLTAGENASTDFIDAGDWQIIHSFVLQECDGIDKAMDGIVEDPALCFPNRDSLVCSIRGISNRGSCLSLIMLTRAIWVFSTLSNRNGTLLFPRLDPGSEVGTFAFYMANNLNPFTTDWFKYAVYNNPRWDASTFSFQDIAYDDNFDLFGISSFDSDLPAFKDAGGHLLMFHGMQDPLIPSGTSVQ